MAELTLDISVKSAGCPQTLIQIQKEIQTLLDQFDEEVRIDVTFSTAPSEAILLMPIEELFVDAGRQSYSREIRCLKEAEIDTIEILLRKTKKELLTLKHFGDRSLDNVEYKLEKLGLQLRR